MTVTVDDLIEVHGLKPHPFEGWSVETARVSGKERTFLWLITAEMFIPWHQMPAETQWTVTEGAACSVSISVDEAATSSVVIGQGYLPAITVPPTADQTLTTIGRFSLLKGRLRPDAALTDRIDRPDNWYPRPDGDGDIPF